MGQFVYVASRKGLFKYERTAKGWEIVSTSFLGDPVTMVLPEAGTGHVYAALKHGHFGVKLHFSTDHGTTWEEIGTPAFPEKPEGVEDLGPGGQPVPWKLVEVWSLESGGKDRPGHLWLGTIPGGLFQSRDSGKSWELVRSLWELPQRKEWFGGGADLPGIHSICVDPTDSHKVTIAVSCGGVWHSADGGDSWENRTQGMYAEYMPPDRRFDPNIQDPHRMVQCPASPSHFWAQHHNGIFRTTDYGKSWTDVKLEPSVFGFATVVHPTRPDTAWFVPAIKDEKRIPVDGQLVVTRTADGGKSGQVLKSGLPERHSYDLVFRHAMDIDAKGDTIAFGSTTGSLWVTENQGDEWKLVNAHLPPVYAVRMSSH